MPAFELGDLRLGGLARVGVRVVVHEDRAQERGGEEERVRLLIELG